MSSVNVTMGEEKLTIFIDSDVFTVDLNSNNIEKIKEAAVRAHTKPTGENVGNLRNLLDMKSYIEEESVGELIVKDGIVYRRSGEKLNNTICEVIFRMFEQGLPYKPLVKFMDKLLSNTSARSIDTLYNFISKWPTFQICDDGDFIAYKGVKTNFKDVHSGKICNKPGSIPKRFKSNEVDDDPNRGCSTGYHAGSIEYASNWGPVVVRVKINPADVRCVPYDCDYQKIRCLGYEVLEEVSPEEVKEYLKVGRTEIYGVDKDNDLSDNSHKDYLTILLSSTLRCLGDDNDPADDNYIECANCDAHIYPEHDVIYYCQLCGDGVCEDCVIKLPTINICTNCA